jgi:ferrochelatase
MTNTSATKALLVMHYGTPKSIDDVLPYYTHIRRGRPPTPEALQDLVDRYQAIGGPSPLTKISEDQATLIQAGLIKRGIDAKLYIGAKHTHPFVGEAIEQIAAEGISEVVGLVLAPHYSSFSIASYRDYAEKARDQHAPSMSLSFIERWGTLPALIDGLATRVAAQLDGWNAEETLVIFSAHSLPQRIMAEGDPYPDELMETSQLVADKLGIPHWAFAFQSASTTGEPWLGPDILDVISANAETYKNVICCTVGFVSDHLEVLYDLGIEARDKCAELSLNFRRVDTINADEVIMDALAGLAADLYTKS